MAAANPEEALKDGAPERQYEDAIRKTKEYAARIHDNPQACPMFPNIHRPYGAAETLCYMQGYLAGRIESAGRMPTKKEMKAIRHNVMHDDAVRDIVVGMQDETLLRPGDSPPPREY